MQTEKPLDRQKVVDGQKDKQCQNNVTHHGAGDNMYESSYE